MRGQIRTKRAAAPITVALVVAALGGCARSSGPTATILGNATGSSVITPGGQAHPGVDGEILVAGDTVLSGSGMPTLEDSGRTTTLAPDTSLHLVSAARYDLLTGQLVVVRRQGPDLAVAAAGVLVDRLGNGAVRVARGFAVRVAVYDGGVRVTAGASATSVPALHEILVPGDALPTAAFPLALSDDALDRVADPGLVTEDITLNSAAAAVDAEASLGPVAEAGLLRATSATFVHPLLGEPLSERLLPLAIARSGPGPVALRYAVARQYRQQGGSWAVVTDLLDAQLSSVESVLASVEDAAANPPSGPVLALSGAQLGASPGPAATIATGAGPAPAPGPSASPTPGPRPTPSTTPAPSPSPSAGPVQQVLDIVTGLVSPSPLASAPPPLGSKDRAAGAVQVSAGQTGGTVSGATKARTTKARATKARATKARATKAQPQSGSSPAASSQGRASQASILRQATLPSLLAQLLRSLFG
ncbi:MAG: hypothetical protein ACYDB7_01450 [Mycobacteriales bacterium]